MIKEDLDGPCNRVQCKHCNQFTMMYDVDLLPDEVLLKWLRTNVSKKTSLVTWSGSECHICEKSRVKNERTECPKGGTKVTSAAELLVLCEDSQAKAEEVRDNRKKYALGLAKYKRKDLSQHKAKAEDEAFGEDFNEGHFYYLRDYMQLLHKDVAARRESLESLCKAAIQMNIEVEVGKDGRWGVKESQLPQGAAYKYKAGDRKGIKLVSMISFADSVEDAKQVRDELMEERRESKH